MRISAVIPLFPLIPVGAPLDAAAPAAVPRSDRRSLGLLGGIAQKREEALIRTVAHLIDGHDWEFSWDPRGLRLTHDGHTLVLGIPAVFLEFLDGTSGA